MSYPRKGGESEKGKGGLKKKREINKKKSLSDAGTEKQAGDTGKKKQAIGICYVHCS